MNASSTVEEKFDVLVRRQQFLNQDGKQAIKEILRTKKKAKIFWGTAPTGKPHIGYLVPLAKIVDFLRAGLDVTVLYADIYSFLINYLHPQPRELVEHRRRYYHLLVTAILQSLGVQTSRIHFVQESSYAYTKSFVSDFSRCCSLMTQQDTPDTMDEEGRTKTLSPLLCCVHQYLADIHLDTDIQFGGEDQRPIFQHASKIIPQLGYRKRQYLMNAMAPGLKGGKMSSSDPASAKIEFLDDARTVTDKIMEIPIGESHGGYSTDNAVLGILRTILIPLSELRLEHHKDEFANDAFVSADAPEGTLFTIEVAIWCFGECVRKHYKSYDEIEEDFRCWRMGEEDLKLAVARSLNCVLEPVRRRLGSSEEWKELELLAYP
ncbi:tyrosyl-tRNA synthetase [Mollisia scopiformis]|uniref:tyrosine--tRNA ligase n=1 Tax=Mollisia scopiformis TaxID=149040 RepID=A0A194XEX7_MOLSC|nr:tyrosyl-tRNA synthetase [Mollisia scopiformis]KUJ18745.1 tyrosyl-tRNA synthetase [Mollisia scopiformis]